VLAQRIDGLDGFAELTTSGHVFDGLIAAYTAWRSPDGLEAPPAGFNLSAGWIWVPQEEPANAA
jgi:hypothetical protein